MKSSIAAWIKKADGDYTTALREYRARKSPNYGWNARLAIAAMKRCRTEIKDALQ